MEPPFSILGSVISLARWLWDAFAGARDTPEKVLAARRKWAPEFYDEIHRCWKEKLSRDVHLRNENALEKYSTGDTSSIWFNWGASNFFRSALLYCDYEGAYFWADKIWAVETRPDQFYEVSDSDRHPFREEYYLLGYVPYEHIVDVLWDGDHATNLPVITCRNWGRRGPAKHYYYYRTLKYLDDMPPSFTFAFKSKHLRRLRDRT